MSEESKDTFEITHKTQIIEFQGESLCSIIDNNAQNKATCAQLLQKGYDYNLKGIILKNTKGHQLACRYILKGDDNNNQHYLDYKIAPSNEWITHLRESKKLAIVDTAGIVMLIGEDVWTGDIETVLQRFYSPNTGQ